MNWVVVSHYWLLLATVGQVNPVYYPPLNFTQDFPNLKSYLSANNIFVNASLYNIYSTYFTTTILPLVRLPSPEFAPLDDGNRLQPTNTTFRRSYSCQVRQQKPPFTAFFSVITTIYVFTQGPFSLVIFFAKYFKTRNNNEGCPISLRH